MDPPPPVNGMVFRISDIARAEIAFVRSIGLDRRDWSRL